MSGISRLYLAFWQTFLKHHTHPLTLDLMRHWHLETYLGVAGLSWVLTLRRVEHFVHLLIWGGQETGQSCQGDTKGRTSLKRPYSRVICAYLYGNTTPAAGDKRKEKLHSKTFIFDHLWSSTEKWKDTQQWWPSRQSPQTAGQRSAVGRIETTSHDQRLWKRKQWLKCYVNKLSYNTLQKEEGFSPNNSSALPNSEG